MESGSSSGFRLPDGSVPTPVASLLQLDRWQSITPEQRQGFAPLCPYLVVELTSSSDKGAPRPQSPASQDGGLSGQWRPPGLAADSSGAGCGGVARRWPTPAPGANPGLGGWCGIPWSGAPASRDLGRLITSAGGDEQYTVGLRWRDRMANAATTAPQKPALAAADVYQEAQKECDPHGAH